MTTPQLRDLFRLYGTDKIEYAWGYELFLRPRRHNITTLLEVGIGTLLPDAPFNMIGWGAAHYRPGGSLRAWRDYLPAADVIGIDVQPDTQFAEDRIRTFRCDSTDPTAIDHLVRTINLTKVDVIIDDGSHRADDQLATLRNLFPFLAGDGLYVIEDVVGNGIFQRKEEIINLIGDAELLSFGLDCNPIFIQKCG